MRRTCLLVFILLVFIRREALPQGNPLGPEFQINTYSFLHQFDPSVSSDSAGNFVVVWTTSLPGGGLTRSRGQRYLSSGMPAGSEFPVSTYLQGAQVTPAVASDGVGDFVAVWAGSGQNGDGDGIFGQRYDAAGAPLGVEFRINAYTTGSQQLPAVASGPSGNFIVVWQSEGQDGSASGIFGQRYAASGAPFGSEFRVNTVTANSQAEPSVAAGGSGNVVVVWQSSDGASAGVFGQRYDGSGAPLGPEFRVNTYTTEAQLFPAVAADASGNFVVTWSSAGQEGEPGGGGGGPPLGVYGQRYSSSGNPLGPEFHVNTYTTNNQFPPAVVSDTAGNFVVVWGSAGQDGSSYGVFGQRYAGSGAPLGAEFLVNTFTNGSQAVPAVASDSAGNFVVVWESDTQDGSGFGVFGQRYSQIVPVELMHFRVE